MILEKYKGVTINVNVDESKFEIGYDIKDKTYGAYFYLDSKEEFGRIFDALRNDAKLKIDKLLRGESIEEPDSRKA